MAMRYLQNNACADVPVKTLVDALADHLQHIDTRFEKATPRDGICGLCGHPLKVSSHTVNLGGTPMRFPVRYCDRTCGDDPDVYALARQELEKRRRDWKAQQKAEGGDKPAFRK